MKLRFGMLLEVATAAGSLLGGITAQVVAGSILERTFGVVAILVSDSRRSVIAVGRNRTCPHSEEEKKLTAAATRTLTDRRATDAGPAGRSK